MRLYQIEMRVKDVQLPSADPNQATTYQVVTEWVGTEREAVVRRSEMFKAGRLVGMKREQLIHLIDVPVDKAGLLGFLIANVTQPVIV